MDFDTYRTKAEQLYDEYLKLWHEISEEMPSHLPGNWRPLYEKFSLIVDLIDSEESILAEIEEFKNGILAQRADTLRYLKTSFPGNASLTTQPKTSDGNKKPFDIDIKKAERSLNVYRRRGEKRLETAHALFGYVERHDHDQKAAARKVRQYLAHAENLVNAAGNGSFYDALTAPLPPK